MVCFLLGLNLGVKKSMQGILGRMAGHVGIVGERVKKVWVKTVNL